METKKHLEKWRKESLEFTRRKEYEKTRYRLKPGWFKSVVDGVKYGPGGRKWPD